MGRLETRLGTTTQLLGPERRHIDKQETALDALRLGSDLRFRGHLGLGDGLGRLDELNNV